MERRHQVRFLPGNETVSVSDGTTLLEAARGIFILPGAFCGGSGTCGKCTVTLLENGMQRTVLACQTRVTSDLTVLLPDSGESEIALEETGSDAFPLSPSDGYAAAFDVGTTTLVCYLLSRQDGRELAVAGTLNPQTSFGADVITRAKYALENNAVPLRAALIGGMNRLLCEVSEKQRISPAQITLCSVVGNSCMQHLLLGSPVRSLVTAPYIPYSTDAVTLPASALGLCVNPDALVRVLPLIGGFVGADTVGCMLAADLQHRPGNTLLMDIGTNGELVLNAEGRSWACSAAAGPAFEGGSICCGMRGAAGAVSHAQFDGTSLTFDVLGGGAPNGICGSGLIDLITCLLRAGIIEPSGRMQERGPLAKRVCRLDGMRAFLIAEAGETASGKSLLLTQKDVREVQLAKSALSTGISLLAEQAGIPVVAIDRVLLAGAFGNTLNPSSACAVGLLPQVLFGRIAFIGNAAGAGACMAARSCEAFEYSTVLARRVQYIDQAASSTFQSRFLEGLAFPAPRSDVG